MRKKTITFCILFFLFSINMRSLSWASFTSGGDTQLTICIDAGHGGEQTGIICTYDGVTVQEKDLNLKIALMLEQELQKYQNVHVVMTRQDDRNIGPRKRMQFALDHGADYVVSVHNNNAGNPEMHSRGCMVLKTVSHYQPAQAKLPGIYEETERMALAIVARLQALGLPLSNELEADINQGVVRRPYNPDWEAKTTSYYPDGSICDFYALIRYGTESGIPTIIIEHAYISNEEECKKYLWNEADLALLAKADAQGLADALHLAEIENENSEGSPDRQLDDVFKE